MKWLFRFDVGGERINADKELAQGLGHANRCLTLARTVIQQNRGDEVLLLAGGDPTAINYFRNLEIPLESNEDEKNVLDTFKPSIIVVDINYLEPDRVQQYQCCAPVVNLAPRGLPKYYADVSFLDTKADDVPQPTDSPSVIQFRGPEYAVVGSQFTDMRSKLDDVISRWNSSQVVVCMGGADYFNLTEAVLENLIRPDDDLQIKVVLGPLYPHTAELKKRLALLPCSVDIVVNPPDIARTIVEASIGIFGMGILTYEALSIGIPSINVGLSLIHQLRGEELSEAGAVIYAGSYNQLESGHLGTKLSELIRNPDRIESMRELGLALVDGRGAERIINEIRKIYESC